MDNKLSKFCAYYPAKKRRKWKNKCKMQQHFVHLHDMVSISVDSYCFFPTSAFLPAAGQLSTVCAARPAGHCLCSFSYTFSTSLFLLVFPAPLFSHACFCADLLCCIVLLLLLFILFEQCFLAPPFDMHWKCWKYLFGWHHNLWMRQIVLKWRERLWKILNCALNKWNSLTKVKFYIKLGL